MRRPALILLVLAAACLAVAVFYAVRSPGTYHDDDLDRYYMAREIWRDPWLLLDRWGMPLTLAVFMAPARVLGYAGVELSTALATALAALLTGVAARGRGLRFPWLGVVFLFFQPIVLELSYSGLAEPLAALILGGVLALWYTERPGRAVALSGLLPLARIDMGVLTVVTLAVGWRRAGWRGRVAAVLPVLLWNALGFLVHGEWLYVLGTGGDRPLRSLGSFFLLRNLIVTAGAVILFFMAWGGIRALVASARRRLPERFPGLALTLGTVHVILLMLLAWEAIPVGRSVGFLRHLVASAPAWALVGAWGAGDWLAEGRNRAGKILFAGMWATVVAAFLSHPLIGHSVVGEGRVEYRWMITLGLGVLGVGLAVRPGRRVGRPPAAAVAVAAVVLALATVRPIQLNPERSAIQAAIEHIRQWQPQGAVVYTNHPWFVFLTGRDRYDKQSTPPLTRDSLAQLRPGQFVLWENHYGPRLWGDVPLELLTGDSRLRRILELTAGTERNFQVVVFQVTG